jgi:hypothetical protein
MTEKLHFDDLTQITAPPVFLDDDTFNRLSAWPHGLEFWVGNGWSTPQMACVLRNNAFVCRARPAPLAPDIVDWSQVTVDWIARDQFGCAYGFFKRPTLASGAIWNQRCYRIDGLIPSYRLGTVDWRDSLISRPGVEGGQ